MERLHIPRRRRNLLALGAATALVGGAAAYKKVASSRAASRYAGTAAGTPSTGTDTRFAELGWGDLEVPAPLSVVTPDAANLAVWDVGSGPVVVLPHCWGCSHAVWIPVARRLVERGYRVVLHDQRGHGASTQGANGLSIEILADDLAAVLDARGIEDAVLAGHSMGGMSIMSLATYRPDVLTARAHAIVLVATAAGDMGSGPPGAERLAAGVIASPAVSLALRASGGRRFVRGVFGTDPVQSHLDLTRTLFADCAPAVRAGFMIAMSRMNLLEGIATIGVPTTVIVGSKDRLTAPARAAQLVAAIPGARLVTLPGRGHMLPLEDPDSVTKEIVRAFED